MTARGVFALGTVAFVLRVLTGLWPPAVVLVNPLLVVAILGALPGRPAMAITTGIATGLIEDVWSGHWLGEHAFSHLVIAYLISLVSSRMDMVALVPATLALLLGSLLDWALQIGLAALFERPLGELPGAGAWAVMVVANALLGLLFYRLARWRGGIE